MALVLSRPDRTITSIARDLGVSRETLRVSRSGFYRWLKGAAARLARRQADEQPAEQVRRVHAEHDGTYGSPRMTAELRAAGIVVNQQAGGTGDARARHRRAAAAQ